MLFDAAHHNVFQPANRSSVVRFLAANGYRATELQEPFRLDALAGVQVVVLEGPLSARNALPDSFTQEEFDGAWSRPVPSAFTEEEIEVLYDWVTGGGGLLLVFDHMPVAGASKDLAGAFGFDVSDGYAVDSELLEGLDAPSVARAGGIVYYRSDGTLADHWVTSAATGEARIDSVATWTGSAFRIPTDAQSLMTLGTSFISLLPDTAWVFSDLTPREAIGGWSQGAIVEVGRGRVAVFAELGILASPEMVVESAADESSNPQIQNPQLLLNVLSWLSGVGGD